MPVDVGALTDFTEGGFRVVRVDGDEVGILLWAGTVYALRNSCPHQLGPLCEGRIRPLLTASAPGKPSLDTGTPVVSCPWHGWEFDARTGSSLWDARYRVRQVQTRVTRGRVLLDLPAHARRRASA